MKSLVTTMRSLLLGLVVGAVSLTASATTTTDIYYHNDLAGTPLAATDANGNLLWRQGYKPYGERLDPKAPAEQQPWFTGKAHVEAAGLSYFGARWYDPQLGRFMGVDPRGFDEANVHSFNRYAYANNNPYRFVDPDGRVAEDLFPTGAPIVAFGRFLGGAAAYAQGAATGNEALKAAGSSGMTENRQGMVEAAIAIASMGRSNSSKALAQEAQSSTTARSAGSQAPDFIVSPSGTAFPVPRSSSGPVPVINESGTQSGVAFVGGRGGANGQVSSMRIMDATSPRGSSPGYPGGYVKYENGARQGVDPYSGRTLPNSQSHHPIE